MGMRDKGESQTIGLPSAARSAASRERERKLRMLKQLGDVLGRPVEDFYKAARDVPQDGSSGRTQG